MAAMIEYSFVNTLQRLRANRVYYQVGGHKKNDDESTDRSYSSDVRPILFFYISFTFKYLGSHV